jgi:peptidoglycan hydrolase-like amidase
VLRMRITHLLKVSFAMLLFALVFDPVCSLVTAQGTRVSDSPVAEVHIGVLGLFHPIELTVSASAGSALVARAGEEQFVLEKSSGVDSVSVHIAGHLTVVTSGSHTLRATELTITGRKGEPVDFILAVPEKITRRYHGALKIKPSAGSLIAIVTMDRETAVASVVEAESTPGTPLEALKAQAVAARSYLVASRGRHTEFDFCDTTHCQFLREPPAPSTAAAHAVAATRGLVLAYASHPIAAMYTRSCSGRTRTPSEVGLAAAAYPYYSVECKHCLAHPARWSSRISAQDAAALRSSDEGARLNIDRRLGWSAVPSNDFVLKTERGQIIVEGTGKGHGIGLCQSGAKAMAEEGADFRQILSHYYPNTSVVNWPAQAPGTSLEETANPPSDENRPVR